MKTPKRLLFSVAAVALLMSPGLRADTITVMSADVPRTIPDNDPGGIASVLSGPDLFNLTDVNLVLANVEHTCVPDLHIELMSPSGIRQLLIAAFTEGGIMISMGEPNNFMGTILDDQALIGLNKQDVDDYGILPPFTGSFNVDHGAVSHPLAAFNGEIAAGTWTLFISDRSEVDSGQLNQWGIEFTGTPVPEPGSLLTFGLGGILCALAAAARRRNAARR